MSVSKAMRVVTKGSPSPSTTIGSRNSARGRAGFDFALSLVGFALAGWVVQTSAAGLDFGALALGAAIAAAITVVALLAAGAYRPRSSLVDQVTVARIGTGVGGAALVLGVLYAAGLHAGLSAATIVCGAALSFALVNLSRLRLWPRRLSGARGRTDQRTIIVGSKDAALAVVRLIDSRKDLPFFVVGCVDDAPDSGGVDGIPILGRIDDLSVLIATMRVANVVVAAPTNRNGLVKRVHGECTKVAGNGSAPPAVKVLPNLDDLLRGTMTASRIRDVRLEDLLGRAPIEDDLAQVAPHLEGRVVLVTGAGGSIGSELCRQIARFRPQLLLLLGHGENSLFAIERELRSLYDYCKTEIVLADVADGHRVSSIFARYRPHVVFHAAAHKHVPILENNVCEAVRNNVFGTHAVALAAAASGVAKFVMISTDKAVNPTSIMGATKRLAESICQSFERRTGTEFVSVRFGNVLGSRGSVLDVFAKQIDAGGPLTITHPEMERFFMTIAEAVSLVLEAMAIGRDGQVFVMDMGEPVSVIELAETFVSLAGLKPYEDIDIVFTGVRPGEKLREELLTTHEGQNPTVHERLFVAQQERIEYDRLVDRLAGLRNAMMTSDAGAVVECLQTLVPTFRPGPHLSTAVVPLDGAAHLPVTLSAAQPLDAKHATDENVAGAV